MPEIRIKKGKYLVLALERRTKRSVWTIYYYKKDILKTKYIDYSR